MKRKRQSTFLSPIFFLSSLLLLLGGIGAWYVQHLYADLATVLESNVVSVRAAEELEIGLREIRSRFNDYTYRKDSADFAAIFSLRATTDHWLEEATRFGTSHQEQEIIGRLKIGYDRFFKQLDAIEQNPTLSDNQDMRHLIDVILTKEIIGPAHEYLDFNEATMTSVVAEQKRFSRRMSFSLLGIGICGCVGGFFAGMHASMRLKRTMVELNLPLSLTAGKLSEVVGPILVSTSLDLKELKRILETISIEVEQVVLRLQKTQQEVLHSEKLAAIGQLAAGTAHEIRNPLMSIKLLVQSALHNSTSVTQTLIATEDLKLIEQEISRLERTVQNLLDFARPPALAWSQFSLKDLVEHCIILVSGRAKVQRVTIHRQTTAECSVSGDYQQLQQVLLNLLINSLDATPAGGEVIVLLEHDLTAQTETQRFKVSVRDSGQGIPAAILPTIFEPFVSSKDSGTGLGLSVSKQIIEAHKGEVFAENQSNGGAVVGFVIPAITSHTSFSHVHA